MSRAEAKRDQIIDRLTDFLLAEGLGAASLRPLAAAAGLSDRMLLYYFKDKEEIIAAALGRAALRLAGALANESHPAPRSAPRLEVELLAMAEGEAFWPFMCLWIEVAALAARGDAFYRAVGEQIARGFQQWIAERLAIDEPAARAEAAHRLLRTVEGALFLRAIGLATG